MTSSPVKDEPPAWYWLSLVLVYALITSIPLLCTGDLGWWQAWVYAGTLFIIGVGGRVAAEWRHPGLMAERVKFGKGQQVQPWDRLLSPLMAIAVVIPVLTVAGLDHRFGWSPTFPLWANLLGIVLITLGYSFATWALVENRYFSSTVRIQLDRGHVLCDTGPYRFVRHPGYAGNILPLFGIVLGLGSLWTLIPAAFALFIIFVRTALEDRTLYDELPGYQDYTRRVRYRLIPGLY